MPDRVESTLIKSRKESCSVCSSDDLVQVVDLPKFPITGIFLTAPDGQDYPNVDQGLLLCRQCGHGQLLNNLDPEYVYNNTYTHRSSLSPIATGGNDFLFEFLKRVTEGRRFRRIVEIGCNDLYMLQKLEPMGEQLVGIDPIWSDQELPSTEKIRVVGKFVEDIDAEQDLGGPPDLLVSAHTFEHVLEPRQQLQRLMDMASPGALFVVEVPGFDSLLTNYRFDQVFHQHIHYFSLASFRRMVDEIGGKYLAHDFNYQYWGGTMMVAFQKDGREPSSEATSTLPRPNEQLVRERYRFFQDQLAHLSGVIDSLRSVPIYGYGAAQMLPTLAYHLQSDMSFLECVLDDDPSRSGSTYPHLNVWIRRPEPDQDLADAGVLVTALDSVRPILRRVISMKPRHILVPLHGF